MDFYRDTFEFARLALQRGMAAIYFLAFLSALRQFKPLLGENGLLPVPLYLKRVSFKRSPSLFHYHYSDRFLMLVCWTGLLLSVSALTGLSESGPIWLSLIVWLTMWAFYLSLVNVGQTFYGFGWESMLLEAGFFVSFLGPKSVQASFVPIVILRWMLFRTEVGAGLIKLRHDRCWRDLTCLIYHYETQPLPNAVSWYFHRLPVWVHKTSVAGSHVVQLILPFGLFAPQPVATICATLIVLQQLWLIVCGNYSWLNWLTVVLAFSGFGDSALGLASACSPRPWAFELLLWALAIATLCMSIEPAKNLVSKEQKMNCSYNSLRLVNSYGAFGSITRERYEVVLEGTNDVFGADGWKEYEFKAKPGDPRCRPPQIAPYHLRLDWQMWFLPFSASVVGGKVRVFRRQVWFSNFVAKLLEGDRDVLGLLKHNPFPEHPPEYIRARYYLYRYTTWEERRETGRWWTRELIGNFMNPSGLKG
jgi:lipase maturation factor